MRPPARLLVLLACLLALAGVTACGSDSESGSALDGSLGYLPDDAPFAVAVDTDTGGEQFKNLDALFKKFPFGQQIKDLLIQTLAKSVTGVDLEKDVVPLLGNPFVVGATDGAGFLGGDGESGFVAAIRVDDEDKLGDLLDKTGAKETGEESGAKVYEESGTEFAVDGDQVVFAGTREQLNAALERQDSDAKLTEEKFDAAQEDLGDPGILRAYVDIQSILASDPDTKAARKVEWIGALRGLGLNASVEDDRVDINFRVDTDADGLTEEDLPIASGDDAPPVIERPGEIGFGIRGLGQTVNFVETVAQAIDPSGFADYSKAKSALEAQLDVDIEKDLLDQLDDGIAASVSLSGDFGARAEPKDPEAFDRTLAKIADVLPSIVEGAGLGEVAIAKPGKGEDFYALSQPDGDGVVFGVVDGVFVLANDADRAGELATDEPTVPADAKGAVVMQADAEQVVNAFLESSGIELPVPPAIARAITKPLGQLSGSLQADTDGISGKISLEIEG